MNTVLNVNIFDLFITKSDVIALTKAHLRQCLGQNYIKMKLFISVLGNGRRRLTYTIG